MFAHFDHRSDFTFILIIVTVLFFISCSSKKSEDKVAPAHVENPVKENDLATIILSEKANERLGIKTALIELRSIANVLKLGGEIIAVPGQEARVSAPVSGIILHARRGALQAGAEVKKGQEVMRLLVMPSGSDMLSAQEEVSLKQVQYEVAQAQAERAEELLKEKAISEKVLQETQAALIAGRTALDAAKARANLLNSADLESIEANLTTLVLESPINGSLQRVLVAHGQTVGATEPLFEVADQNPVWVRVAAYVGDVVAIDLTKNALVSPLGGRTRVLIPAKPVQGPPLSNAGNASSDLYYKLNNDAGTFRVGQKVMVSLSQISLRQHNVIPYSAILYDMYGGTWLYVKTEVLTYTRQRVQVDFVIDEMAVLARGAKTGDEVVIAGSMELFGTEFGGGK